MKFVIISPTITTWLEIMRQQRDALLNPRPQMNVLLNYIREDIDSQFDEKQGSWKPLRPYTIDKKTANDKDLRILHETRIGEGLRLRDAYKLAGFVDENGKLFWTYPETKPYARELDKGGDTVDERAYRGAGRKNIVAREAELDREFNRIFGFDNEDIFKKPRVEKPKKKKQKRG